MLVLSRKVQEKIVIATEEGPVTLRVLGIRGGRVSIGFDGPRVPIYRKEVSGARKPRQEAAPVSPAHEEHHGRGPN